MYEQVHATTYVTIDNIKRHMKTIEFYKVLLNNSILFLFGILFSRISQSF